MHFVQYLYNFWETEFKDGIWIGEDVKFCDLVKEAGFKFHFQSEGTKKAKSARLPGKEVWAEAIQH